jgi:hypothetical protein
MFRNRFKLPNSISTYDLLRCFASRLCKVLKQAFSGHPKFVCTVHSEGSADGVLHVVLRAQISELLSKHRTPKQGLHFGWLNL